MGPIGAPSHLRVVVCLALAGGVAVIAQPARAEVIVPAGSWRPGFGEARGPAGIAADRLSTRLARLGGIRQEQRAPVATEARARIVKELGPASEPPWRRDQGFAIELNEARITVSARTAAGLAFGLAELEVRSVLHEGRPALEFPEWSGPGPHRLESLPAIEERGEYLNIGYDVPGITPHRWSPERWREYIDRLALARLNRFYFYLWTSDVTAYRGSKYAQSETSRRLFSLLPGAIRYAQQRGMRVTLLVGPSMIPRDIFEAHPDWRADIEYARAGFPVVCPSHPDAWRLGLAVTEASIRALRGIDAVQVWFYDPGGCWCTTRGCKDRQAASLVRQVVDVDRLFRRTHPRGGLEVSLWPMLAWEHNLKLQYRAAFVRGLKEAFLVRFHDITVVGTPERGPTPQPTDERDMGFRTAAFMFGANPESNYAFPTPHLRYMPEAIGDVHRMRLNACFTHRLEAWTRYPATFLTGQWMWSPTLPATEAVRRYSRWATGGGPASVAVAEALSHLERFTDGGADQEVGRAMSRAADRALAEVSADFRSEVAPLAAACAALKAIGDSVGDRTPEALKPFEEAFAAALRSCPEYAPMAPNAAETFRHYRELLLPGWRKRPF